MAHVILIKAHVKGYARKDGTFVQEHDDKRAAAHPRPISHHADQLGKFAESFKHASGNDDHHTFKAAADHMKAGDHKSLSATLKTADTFQREKILDHIHPDHWEGLGHKPLNKDRAMAHYHHTFGAPSSPEIEAKAKKAPKQKAKVKVNTQNEGYGFHGEALAQSVRDKHGPDKSPYDLPEHEQLLHGDIANKRFSEAANKLVQGGHFPDHEQARDYLDSTHGRHLHDGATMHGGDITKVPWLAADVAHYKKAAAKAPLTKSILVKAHVNSYTRKDGTFVKEHDDKRTKKADAGGFKKGDRVTIYPEFQDVDDHMYEWYVVSDEENGRVNISPKGTGLSMPIKVAWIQKYKG